MTIGIKMDVDECLALDDNVVAKKSINKFIKRLGGSPFNFDVEAEDLDVFDCDGDCTIAIDHNGVVDLPNSKVVDLPSSKIEFKMKFEKLPKKEVIIDEDGFVHVIIGHIGIKGGCK